MRGRDVFLGWGSCLWYLRRGILPGVYWPDLVCELFIGVILRQCRSLGRIRDVRCWDILQRWSGRVYYLHCRVLPGIHWPAIMFILRSGLLLRYRWFVDRHPVFGWQSHRCFRLC